MPTKFGRNKSKRGSVLLLAIFFLIMLFSLAVTFFRIIPAEYHAANQARKDIQAQYAGEAGVREAIGFLKTRESHLIDSTFINDYNSLNYAEPDTSGRLSRTNPVLVANRVDDDWSYTSRIDLTDSDFLRRYYVVRSTSYFRGKAVRETVSSIQNESFAKFALFYDNWAEQFLFTMAPNGIQGPVHTNGYFRLVAPDGSFWDNDEAWVNGPLAEMTHAQSFTDSTQSYAGDGNLYFGGNFAGGDESLIPYDASGPIADRYDKIVNQGREKLRLVQNIPLPDSTEDLREKAWAGDLPSGSELNSLVASKGPILVQTKNGQPNEVGGEVAGGIFIKAGRSVNDMLLDITPEGHQKTRIRTGNTSVPGPPSTRWMLEVPRYRVQYTRPPEPIFENRCIREAERQENITESYSCPEERTEANGSRCGYDDVLVPGEGGVVTTIRVARTCTFTVNRTCTRVTGTRTVRYCAESERIQTGTRTFDPEWRDADADTPGAVPHGTRTIEVDADTPDAVPETTETTRSIPNWNSVVEVNEGTYEIPAGVMVNGEVTTSATTVPDGHTVIINNDHSDSLGNYAEYTVLEGRTNGVVYSDEHIYGLRGTNKGAYYEDESGNLESRGRVIATDLRKDIQIRDSILQYYDGDGVNGEGDNLNDGRNRIQTGNGSPDPKHILGLIGRNVDINPSQRSDRYDNGRTNLRETGFNGGHFRGGITVYAVIMAGYTDNNGNPVGGFGAHNSAMNSNDGLGDFNLSGGIISANAKQTQRGYSWSGGFTTGFRLNLNYDAIAAEFLENFPTTNTYTTLRYVTYSVGSWRQESEL